MCIVKSFATKKISMTQLTSQETEDLKPLQKNCFTLEAIEFPKKLNNPPCFLLNSNLNLTQSDISHSHAKKTSLLSRKKANRQFTNIQQDQVQLRSKSYNTNKQSGLFKIGNKNKIARYNSENKINSDVSLKMSHSEVSTRDTVRTQNHNSQQLLKRFTNVNFSINKTSYDCFLQNQINKQSLKLSKEIQKQQRSMQLSESNLVKKKLRKIPIFSPFLDESYKENEPKTSNFRISKKRPQSEKNFPEQLILGFMNEPNQMKSSAIKQDNKEKNRIYAKKKYMSHNIKYCFGSIIGKKQHQHSNLQQQY